MECFSSHSKGGTQSVSHLIQRVGHGAFFISFRGWHLGVFHLIQRVGHGVFFISFGGWDTECFSSHSEGGTQSVFHLLQRVGHRAFFISSRVWDMERFSSHPEDGTWHPAIILRLGRGEGCCLNRGSNLQPCYSGRSHIMTTWPCQLLVLCPPPHLFV